jgi:hypothetical protein
LPGNQILAKIFVAAGERVAMVVGEEQESKFTPMILLASRDFVKIAEFKDLYDLSGTPSAFVIVEKIIDTLDYFIKLHDYVFAMTLVVKFSSFVDKVDFSPFVICNTQSRQARFDAVVEECFDAGRQGVTYDAVENSHLAITVSCADRYSLLFSLCVL